jgi:hypothetical protein
LSGEKLELTWQLKEAVWQRQNGMCGFSGKKFDELIYGEVEYHFRLIVSEEEGGSADIDNCVMLWNQYKNIVETRDDNIKIQLKRYNFPYANFQNYSYEMMHKDIADDVEYCIDTATTHEDVNIALNYVKDTIQNLKSLKLEKEHREELLEKLRVLADELTAKKEEKKVQDEHNYQENFEKLKALVDETLLFAAETDDFKQARDKLIHVQNEIKNFNLKKSHREELFTLLNSTFEELNKKQSDEREGYEMECIENFHNIKAKVDEALKYLSTAEDLQDARRHLIETQGSFKGLRLKKEQREEQYNRVMDAFDLLSKKIDEERKHYEEECSINYERMKTVVFEAVKFSANAEIFKDARERLVDAQNQVKSTKLKREQKDDLFNILRTAFDDLNERQDSHREEFEKESAESWELMKPMIDEVIEFSKTATYFKDAREKLNSTMDLLKEKRLKRDLRDELFEALRKAFDELNIRQDAEKESFDKECEDNYKLMKENADKAIAFADSSDDFAQARQNLITAQQTIKSLKLKKEQREELYTVVRESFNRLNERSEADREIFEKESEENYQLLKGRVEKAIEDAKTWERFREIREMLITLQNDIKILKLKKKHRESFLAKIREAFNIFDARQKEYFHDQKQLREEKLVLALSNLKERKSRIDESIARDKESLKAQTDRIEAIKDDVSATRALVETEKRIAQINDRLKEKEDTLAGINTRIAEIMKDLNIR